MIGNKFKRQPASQPAIGSPLCSAVNCLLSAIYGCRRATVALVAMGATTGCAFDCGLSPFSAELYWNIAFWRRFMRLSKCGHAIVYAAKTALTLMHIVWVFFGGESRHSVSEVESRKLKNSKIQNLSKLEILKNRKIGSRKARNTKIKKKKNRN